MARITWQNVDAPDLDAALEAQSMGARAFQDAISGIGSAISGIGARKKDAANADAMNQILKYDDVGAWDKAIQQYGISALGIDPGQASAELLSAVAGRRGTLEGLRTDRRVEEDRARGLEAGRIADQVIGGAASVAGAQEAILKLGLDYRTEAEALAAATAADPSNWAINPGTRFDDDVTQTQLDESRSAIEQKRRELAYDFEKNPLDKLWVEAPSRYGEYGSTLEGMTERLGATVSDEDQERFGRSKGEVTRNFNTMKSQYPDVPEAVIAAVMEDSLKATGVARLWDSAQKFDWTEVHKKLEQFNDPVTRGDMELRVQGFNKQKENLDNTVSALDRLESETLLLIQKGTAPKSEIDRRKAQIAELRASLGTQQKAVSEADELIASFNIGGEYAASAKQAVASDSTGLSMAEMGNPDHARRAQEILAEATGPEPVSDEELAVVVQDMQRKGMSPQEIKERALQLLGEALAGR